MSVLNFEPEFRPYDDSYARSGDPETSQQAALSANKVIARQIRARMVELLRMHDGMGGEELELRMTRDPFLGEWITPSGLRTRRAQMVREGIIRDSGRRNITRTNRTEIVWELVSD